MTDSSPYALEYAQLHWRDGELPESSAYGDIYFSVEQGLAESRFVFLQQNALAERWRALDPAVAGCFRIAETGFGTGLNFLAAWQLWRQCAPPSWRLEFVSVEKHPLRLADLQRALRAWPELAELAQALLAAYPPLLPGQHSIALDGGRLQLHLLLGDACECLEQLCDHPEHRDASPAVDSTPRVDAWFLDGFAPAKNPALWQPELFALMARLSRAGSSFATFTAAGLVRRGLQAAGFACEKVKGFGRKREMLRGRFIAAPPAQVQQQGYSPRQLPYPSPSRSSERRALVIGAGIAGCSTAAALAARGWQVAVYEQAPAAASGASGNPQGMLYIKPSAQAGTLNRYTLASFVHALRYYRQLQQLHALDASSLQFCGVLQLAGSEQARANLAKLRQAFAQHPELLYTVDADQASALAGIAVDHPGWFFPAAGWIAPAAICAALLAQPGITLHTQCAVAELARDEAAAQWRLHDQRGGLIDQAAVVVIANNQHCQAFAQTRELPLKNIRGQISSVRASRASQALRCVVCHEGYITPAINERHCLGATFDQQDHSAQLRPADQQRNLASLGAAIGSLAGAFDDQALAGRVGFRCSTPDYLPLVGPVADRAAFIAHYRALRKNARARASGEPPWLPGLYINSAHGSRGMISAPLAGELLAALIGGDIRPLPRDLLQAINPGRFILRDLIRGAL